MVAYLYAFEGHQEGLVVGRLDVFSHVDAIEREARYLNRVVAVLRVLVAFRIAVSVAFVIVQVLRAVLNVWPREVQLNEERGLELNRRLSVLNLHAAHPDTRVRQVNVALEVVCVVGVHIAVALEEVGNDVSRRNALVALVPLR